MGRDIKVYLSSDEGFSCIPKNKGLDVDEALNSK